MHTAPEEGKRAAGPVPCVLSPVSCALFNILVTKPFLLMKQLPGIIRIARNSFHLFHFVLIHTREHSPTGLCFLFASRRCWTVRNSEFGIERSVLSVQEMVRSAQNLVLRPWTGVVRINAPSRFCCRGDPCGRPRGTILVSGSLRRMGINARSIVGADALVGPCFPLWGKWPKADRGVFRFASPFRSTRRGDPCGRPRGTILAS